VAALSLLLAACMLTLADGHLYMRCQANALAVTSCGVLVLSANAAGAAALLPGAGTAASAAREAAGAAAVLVLNLVLLFGAAAAAAAQVLAQRPPRKPWQVRCFSAACLRAPLRYCSAATAAQPPPASSCCLTLRPSSLLTCAVLCCALTLQRAGAFPPLSCALRLPARQPARMPPPRKSEESFNDADR
jgi:hypothetical protein